MMQVASSIRLRIIYIRKTNWVGVYMSLAVWSEKRRRTHAGSLDGQQGNACALCFLKLVHSLLALSILGQPVDAHSLDLQLVQPCLQLVQCVLVVRKHQLLLPCMAITDGFLGGSSTYNL